LIGITPQGIEQAKQAGHKLKDIVKSNNTCILFSPYVRAEQTADVIAGELKCENIKMNTLLSEMQYGKFWEFNEEEWHKVFPDDYAEYINYKKQGSKFMYRFPSGESPYDVANRIHILLKEINNLNYDNVLLVSHAITLKAFKLVYFGYSINEHNNMKSMDNCAIYKIKNFDWSV
jgi:probable phosphoglycerate mutase